jgi:hypothetical protein
VKNNNEIKNGKDKRQMIKIPQHDSTTRLKDELAKLAELHKQRSAEQAELDKTTNRYLLAKRPTEQSRLEAEADQLLDGAAKGVEPTAPSDDFEAIEHRIAVLDVAIQRQHQKIDKVRSEFSSEVCNANRDQYILIEKRIAKAVAELAAANQSEINFFNELTAAGCSSITFRPMRVSSLGLLNDPNSRASLHLREIREFCPQAAV